MKLSIPYLVRFRHVVGASGTAVLMLPILVWVWLAAKAPVLSVFRGAVFRFVLSGKLFSEHFSIRHAGSAFDQPTIGKWLFLFTLMSVSALPYAGIIRWLSNREKKSVFIVYAFCCSLLGVFLLCMLSWPSLWLIQYVHSMGTTPRRIKGFIYIIFGVLVVIGFVISAFIGRVETPDNAAHKFRKGLIASAVFASLFGVLTVFSNWRIWADTFYCLHCVDHKEAAAACLSLFNRTQVTNDYHPVTYFPGKNWESLPPELRKLNLPKGIRIGTHSMGLWRSRDAILVLKESKTDPGVFEFSFNNERVLCVVGKKVLQQAERQEKD